MNQCHSYFISPRSTRKMILLVVFLSSSSSSLFWLRHSFRFLQKWLLVSVSFGWCVHAFNCNVVQLKPTFVAEEKPKLSFDYHHSPLKTKVMRNTEWVRQNGYYYYRAPKLNYPELPCEFSLQNWIGMKNQPFTFMIRTQFSKIVTFNCKSTLSHDSE